ncbi:unnamed protein product [Discula destructiva]
MSLLDVPPPYTTRDRRSKSLDPARRKPKQRKYVPDPIDKLDSTSFGGFYHHGGPYDAARPSFNINPKFSPIAATKEGNKAAWEATPREAQLDAILKGRPLDNVAAVPPGHRAMNGQVMDYQEGADMMRDLNPGGGAYKRWPGIQYHHDDLKGKGEPGYTIDKERKAAKAAATAKAAAAKAGGVGRSRSARDSDSRGLYEMMPPQTRRRSQSKGGAVDPVLVRQRSSSASAVVASGSRPSATQLKEGLKRRFGSLKRK